MHEKDMEEYKPIQEIGCLGIMSRIIFIILGVFLVYSIGKKAFCDALGTKCIDAETGEYFSVPWSSFAIGVGIAVILFGLDRFKYRN